MEESLVANVSTHTSILKFHGMISFNGKLELRVVTVLKAVLKY